MKKAAFLTAEWRKLAMANYVIDPEILKPFVPAGTELDVWNGRCYVSLVGFCFLNTKLKGLPIPFHRNFPEVNLRFYVRYFDLGEWKRGVVFIKEIVPKPMLTFVARTVYGEPYATMPMRYSIEEINNELLVAYGWKTNEQWYNLRVHATNNPFDFDPKSEEAFITEHYWGYTAHKNGQTSEYGVEHPSWKVYHVTNYAIQVDFGAVYGNTFEFLNGLSPQSVLLAEGSEILVRSGRKLPNHH